MKRIWSAAAAILLVCTFCVTMAGASSGGTVTVRAPTATISNLNELGSISIKGYSTPSNADPANEILSGVTFKLYRVASVSADIWFTPTDNFVDAVSYASEMNGLDDQGWFDLAAALSQYVGTTEDLEPDALMITDANGNAIAEDLEKGLWLITSEVGLDSTDYGWYVGGFLVSLPYVVNGSWTDAVSIDVSDAKMSKAVDEFRVLKVWDDDDDSAGVRPDSVDIDVYKDGELYTTVTLSEENNWYVDLTELPLGVWTADEPVLPARYTSTVTQEGNTIIVTNTYNDSGGGNNEGNDPSPDPTPDPTPTPGTTDTPNTTDTPTNTPTDNPTDTPTDVPTNTPEDVNIPDEDVPLAEPTLPPTTDIPDEEIPLGDIPVEDIPIDDPDTPLGGRDPEPDNPGTDIPDDGVPLTNLPQTGMLWWPVPILGLCGVCSVTVGVGLRKREDDGEE